MLGYCNLAGPAFIFGMLSSLFTKPYIPWVLWAIHLLTSFIVFFFFRDRNHKQHISASNHSFSISDILLRSVKTICQICAWVFLFRILLTVLNTRLLYRVSTIWKIIISGLLELTNGCCLLPVLSEPLRFTLCSAFLGFGGVCVLLQTASITKELRIKYYLYGKILHSILSIVFALVLLPVLF